MQLARHRERGDDEVADVETEGRVHHGLVSHALHPPEDQEGRLGVHGPACIDEGEAQTADPAHVVGEEHGIVHRHARQARASVVRRASAVGPQGKPHGQEARETKDLRDARGEVGAQHQVREPHRAGIGRPVPAHPRHQHQPVGGTNPHGGELHDVEVQTARGRSIGVMRRKHGIEPRHVHRRERPKTERHGVGPIGRRGRLHGLYGQLRRRDHRLAGEQGLRRDHRSNRGIRRGGLGGFHGHDALAGARWADTRLAHGDGLVGVPLLSTRSAWHETQKPCHQARRGPNSIPTHERPLFRSAAKARPPNVRSTAASVSCLVRSHRP